MGLYKIKPVFKEMIWGGSRLNGKFGFDIPSKTTGEAWVVSAHPDGDGILLNGEFEGQRLSDVYREHRGLFGKGENTKFPLMVKIIDANQDLSVQVHPDDEYGQKFENSYGKTEAWYVLDCEEDTRMIIGHTASETQELLNAIQTGTLEKYLNSFKINPGDFYYIPARTIHAICAGSLVYEVQQNSNVTYRVYDYNRKDAQGKTRDLHIRQALEVTQVPHRSVAPRPLTVTSQGMSVTTYLDEDYFALSKLVVQGGGSYLLRGEFSLIGVLEGEAKINGIPFKLGDHAITTHDEKTLEIVGDCVVMVSIPREVLL